MITIALILILVSIWCTVRFYSATQFFCVTEIFSFILNIIMLTFFILLIVFQIEEIILSLLYFQTLLILIINYKNKNLCIDNEHALNTSVFNNNKEQGKEVNKSSKKKTLILVTSFFLVGMTVISVSCSGNNVWK